MLLVYLKSSKKKNIYIFKKKSTPQKKELRKELKTTVEKHQRHPQALIFSVRKTMHKRLQQDSLCFIYIKKTKTLAINVMWTRGLNGTPLHTDKMQ